MDQKLSNFQLLKEDSVPCSLSHILYHSFLYHSSVRLQIGPPGFDPRKGNSFFLVSACRPAFGPTQPPIQWVLTLTAYPI